MQASYRTNASDQVHLLHHNLADSRLEATLQLDRRNEKSGCLILQAHPALDLHVQSLQLCNFHCLDPVFARQLSQHLRIVDNRLVMSATPLHYASAWNPVKKPLSSRLQDI